MQLENINNNNLFLIGMMGSWKSTVGHKLAKALDMEFIDTDDAIEEMTEMKITDIFIEFGEKRFREMESAFFIEKAKQPRQIFSTGGGIVLVKKNRKILRKNGICFFLEAKPKTLVQRIHNTSKRPLVAGSNNLEDRLQNIWNERKQYYKYCAQHIITTDHLKPPQVLSKILNILEIPIADH
jgi:shikimate kinase